MLYNVKLNTCIWIQDKRRHLHVYLHFNFSNFGYRTKLSHVAFWVTVCKTVRHMLSDSYLSCLSVCPDLSVCNVGVLWPNGWMDQDVTWCGRRPRPRPHCVRWRPSSPPQKWHRPSLFGPCLLRPNGWMDRDATWTQFCRVGVGGVKWVLPAKFHLNVFIVSPSGGQKPQLRGWLWEPGKSSICGIEKNAVKVSQLQVHPITQLLHGLFWKFNYKLLSSYTVAV